jgi:hypothetical protein
MVINVCQGKNVKKMVKNQEKELMQTMVKFEENRKKLSMYILQTRNIIVLAQVQFRNTKKENSVQTVLRYQIIKLLVYKNKIKVF